MPASPPLVELELAVPLTSFSMFTKPSTRVLLPSCRKVRSRGWAEKQVSSVRRSKGPFPSHGTLSVLGSPELRWEGTESQDRSMKNVGRGASFGKTHL